MDNLEDLRQLIVLVMDQSTVIQVVRGEIINFLSLSKAVWLIHTSSCFT